MAYGFNTHFAVIDLETLGRYQDACILSLGLTLSRYDDKNVTFDELVSNGLYLKFDLREQLEQGRSKDRGTIEWWYKQSSHAQKVLKPLSTDISLYQVGSSLENFFKEKGIDFKKVDIYDRNSFDVNKLQYLFEDELEGKVPWNYLCVYEISTALRFCGFNRYAGMRVEDIPGAVYHDALHDAAVDHLRIMKVLHTEN